MTHDLVPAVYVRNRPTPVRVNVADDAAIIYHIAARASTAIIATRAYRYHGTRARRAVTVDNEKKKETLSPKNNGRTRRVFIATYVVN